MHRPALKRTFATLEGLQDIGNSRCPTALADLVLVCHTSSEDKRTHGPGYEKVSAV